MSAKLKKQVAAEMAHLDQLMASFEGLLDRASRRAPDLVELAALASLLHSFYSGVENILKRIAVELDGSSPSGDSWHRDLLSQMAQAGEKRPAVISPGLCARLAKYLAFRHVFSEFFSRRSSLGKDAASGSGPPPRLRGLPKRDGLFS